MVRRSFLIRAWQVERLAALWQASQNTPASVRLSDKEASVDVKDLQALLRFLPVERSRVVLSVDGPDEKQTLAALGRLLESVTEPVDSLERYFELCRVAAPYPEEDKARSWVRVRRLMSRPMQEKLTLRLKRFAAGTGRARISDRKDLVLLLLYVKGRFGHLCEGVLGTTRILKLLFLATKQLPANELVAVPYRFVPYRFGPFTGQVYDDLEMLIQTGLVERTELDQDGTPTTRADADLDEGFRFNGLATLYRLTEKGEQFARALLADVERRRPGLAEGLAVLKARFGRLPLRDLVRYIYTNYPEFATESEIAEQVLGEEDRTQ